MPDYSSIAKPKSINWDLLLNSQTLIIIFSIGLILTLIGISMAIIGCLLCKKPKNGSSEQRLTKNEANKNNEENEKMLHYEEVFKL